MWNARLDESQAGIKITGRNINKLRYADNITLMAESEEELKSLLMKIKESEKAGLEINMKKAKVMIPSPITSWQIEEEKVEVVTNFIFLSSKITVNDDCNHEIKRQHAPWKESYDKPRQHIKKQRHHFVNKSLQSQSYAFSSSPVQMWELNQKEGWALKNWCFQIVMLEKTLESPMDCKEIKPANPKGNQPWIYIGRTVAKALILRLPDVKR